ncbi:hypothetical protein HPB51_010767 [Rhipicephalus microplus]|uniref:peptidylprolyl isomerase n=1 Tax=Rhipicephalus microplus TaxID=6941 RepID=A0A9J6DU72_RHIMP|nr:hypothetical protein HPB51_010767 [Rhipicephalus microplus]
MLNSASSAVCDIDMRLQLPPRRCLISKYLKEQLPAAQAAGLKDLPDTDKMVEEIFQHEDKDRDGVISREEFSGPKHDEL